VSQAPTRPGPSPSELAQIASAFTAGQAIVAIRPLGSGNVNDTYLVELADERLVLQRLNTGVFREPRLVMHNLQRLSDHVEARLAAGVPQLQGQRWQLPRVLCAASSGQPWLECERGGFWRCMSHVGAARSVDVIEGAEQARELGFGLGMFHLLIADLPADELADTLEGFHITPGYLRQYHRALVRTGVEACSAAQDCIRFIREREAMAAILEDAKATGELMLRPIHGDPKINNVMLDQSSGRAVALVDLDTVKPGLIHYDIGDCLRSCCNRLGEETEQVEAVHFDLDLAAAMLEGYLGVAGDVLSAADLRYIADSARLISFELGLRFFSDYLSGDTYFRARHAKHNLQRARVQFQLTASIEAQERPLRRLVEELGSLARR